MIVWYAWLCLGRILDGTYDLKLRSCGSEHMRCLHYLFIESLYSRVNVCVRESCIKVAMGYIRY